MQGNGPAVADKVADPLVLLRDLPARGRQFGASPLRGRRLVGHHLGGLAPDGVESLSRSDVVAPALRRGRPQRWVARRPAATLLGCGKLGTHPPDDVGGRVGVQVHRAFSRDGPTPLPA
jgi:hypothetical protein